MANEKLGILRDRGILISLDDFGQVLFAFEDA
jgi:EAL domain-containing protein (putative c-di-GMP-specific phosphodiesterase class I)